MQFKTMISDHGLSAGYSMLKGWLGPGSDHSELAAAQTADAGGSHPVNQLARGQLDECEASRHSKKLEVAFRHRPAHSTADSVPARAHR
ncbi:hypothetical protein GCM10009679_59810 [Saccharothrix algeriensis]|uniref:Uncharacterized protein n=1 Tax=Catellatospora bangladeshensis TaxID=310355 RepID=A0A8J3NJ58_9ACTN|nr:hypothetical protein Cba03nite_44740 [Catellatospora bangladeshensis]